METEVFEAMKIRRFIRLMPTWHEESHRAIADKTDTYLSVKRYTAFDETIYALATGITPAYRAFAICGIVLPKLAIAAVTLVYAAGYVLLAETNEGPPPAASFSASAIRA